MPLRINIDDFQQTKIGQNAANQEIVRKEFAGPPAGSSSPTQALARLDDPERQHQPVQALAGSTPAKARRKKSVVICVEIVRYGVRALDEDNLVAGAKPLRDAIARSLGVDDADKRIRWRYNQVVTECSTGTLVRIERIK